MLSNMSRKMLVRFADVTGITASTYIVQTCKPLVNRALQGQGLSHQTSYQLPSLHINLFLSVFFILLFYRFLFCFLTANQMQGKMNFFQSLLVHGTGQGDMTAKRTVNHKMTFYQAINKNISVFIYKFNSNLN